MKLKYFLRGLGFGILVTVAIFLIFQKLEGDQSYISDQEIMERAAILGMVKEDDRKEVSPEPASSPNPEEPAIEPSLEPTPSETPSKEPTPEPAKDTAENKTPEKGKDISEDPQEPEYISITIEKGMWSEAVSEKLKEAGLIESVEEFNRYLTDNEYSNYIFAGTYQIEKNAAYEDIAKIITGN